MVAFHILVDYANSTIHRAGIKRPEPNYLQLERAPGVKGDWVKPTPHLIVGDVKRWAEQAKVACARVPGYWIEKEGVDRLPRAPAKRNEKVLYHLHGGGFISHSAHPTDSTANIPRGILAHTPMQLERAFCLEYRLSKGPPQSAPANPFPAALLDAIAGYSYLINDVGFPPEDIIVEGDSAGGNLALALVRYLVENASRSDVVLPPRPGALILCSPWVYLGPNDLPKNSQLRKVSSAYTMRETDFIGIIGKKYTREADWYIGPLGSDAGLTNRYISPASESPNLGRLSYEGFPRTFILGGGVEVLVDQIRLLAKNMIDNLGYDRVEYLEQPLGMHDFLFLTWHEPERTQSLKRLSEWLFSQPDSSGGGSWVPRAKL